MHRGAILLCLCMCFSSSEKIPVNTSSGGGNETYAFVVRICERTGNNWHQCECQGTFITKNQVLTAAHCMKADNINSTYYVKVPEHGNISVIHIDSYPDDNRKKCRKTDLAVLKVNVSISITSIPAVNGNFSLASQEGFTVIRDRNGAKYERVRLIIFNGTVCDKAEKIAPYIHNNICAATIGDTLLKRGDSGSPLLVDEPNQGIVLVGILACAFSNLSNETYPAAFVKVLNYNKWIQEVISDISGPSEDGPKHYLAISFILLGSLIIIVSLYLWRVLYRRRKQGRYLVQNTLLLNQNSIKQERSVRGRHLLVGTGGNEGSGSGTTI